MHKCLFTAFACHAVMCGPAVAQGGVVIPVLPPTPRPMIAPTCTLEVCCTNIGSGGGIAWHCFTKCTKTFPDGRTEVTACRGGPTGLFRDLWPEGVPGFPNSPPPCNGWTFFNGAWGPIDTYCGPFERGASRLATGTAAVRSRGWWRRLRDLRLRP